MAYLAFRCFTYKIGKIIIISLHILMALLAAIHWGLAGAYGNIRSKTIDYYDSIGLQNNSFRDLQDPMLKLLDFPIGYFSISGIFQFTISILAILLFLEVLGKENRLTWARILIILLIFEFGFSFFIAVYTSMMSSYYNSLWKDQIQSLYGPLYQYLSSEAKNYFNSIDRIISYTTAMAVLTWVLAIPSSCVLIISFLDQILNENSISEMGKFAESLEGGEVKAGETGQNQISMNRMNTNNHTPELQNTKI